MWNALKDKILAVLAHCVGHEMIRDAPTFIEYVKKCQVTTTFFFNGSTDEPLAEQLKNLYLKQEFSRFAYENQGKTRLSCRLPSGNSSSALNPATSRHRRGPPAPIT